jgi:hypothetical protein
LAFLFTKENIYLTRDKSNCRISEAIAIFSIYIYHITANPALRGHLLNKVKANPALRGHILNKVKANPALRGHLLNKVKANPALRSHLLNRPLNVMVAIITCLNVTVYCVTYHNEYIPFVSINLPSFLISRLTLHF